MLNDRMVYAGIRTSRRFARLSWFHRDFFYGLLNAADECGRFENDADVLRAALYAPLLSRVSKRDVQGAVIACHQAGLVKLWTGVDGRGYGEVVNYRQTGLKRRRSNIPPPQGAPPEPGLFGDGTDEEKEEKRRKGGGRAERAMPPAPDFLVESLEDWLARLRAQWPGVDVPAEVAAAEKAKAKQGRKLEREWFERHWLPKCSPVVSAGELPWPGAESQELPEPEGWREVIAQSVYGPGGQHEARTWGDLPRYAQEHVLESVSRK